MSVLDSVGFTFASDELEAPDVVSEVRPGDEARFDQVHQVAVHRGAVETDWRESLGDVAVAKGCHCGFELLQGRDARRGPTKPRGSKSARQLCGRPNRARAGRYLALDHVIQISSRAPARQRSAMRLLGGKRLGPRF
jgi:hypothetical protein